MTIVLEADDVLDAIIARLKADTGAGGVNTLTGGRIYRNTADPNAAKPYLLVSLLASGPDLTSADGAHVQQNVTALTKVVGSGVDHRPVLTIAKRVAIRLDGYGEVQYGDTWIVRLRRFEIPAQPDDYSNGIRTLYHNQAWYTEAEPAT